MDELIKIEVNENQEPIVSGRELHKFLGIETRYNDWFSRMLGYGFEEGKDFYSFLSKSSNGGRPSTDHAFSLDMAKEIAMIQRNEKGKQARQYFIECEKQLKANTPALPNFNDPVAAARAWADAKEAEQKALAVIEEQKPKVSYYNDLVDKNTLSSFRDTAKMLGVKQKKFINYLLDMNFIFRDQRGTLKPYAEYSENGKGYFSIKDWRDDRTSGQQTLVTVEGRNYFKDLVEEIQ